ncbi:uncharacterized protein SCHCODRAFT_01080019 [Schizophyllum commune H4-8]|nr:uncharacterized protein SCHCODRAFT_01080019 [Schizophyllum commune H4-8]KAI5898408.1 hypothetical protein SCHCODRAFT_01080019 [Schizophyllum commune H4-8]
MQRFYAFALSSLYLLSLTTAAPITEPPTPTLQDDVIITITSTRTVTITSCPAAYYEGATKGTRDHNIYGCF